MPDNGFDRADTIDAFPPLTSKDLDRIGREREPKMRRRRVVRGVGIGGAVLLAAAVLIAGWEVTRYDNHQAPAAQVHTTKPAHQAAASSPPSPAPSPTPSPSVSWSSYLACDSPISTPCSPANLKRQPTSVYLSGDGSNVVGSINWSGWGQAQATGQGLDVMNNCIPYCYDSTSYTDTPVTVTLSDPVPYGSGQVYNTMVVTGLPGGGSTTAGGGQYTGLTP